MLLNISIIIGNREEDDRQPASKRRRIGKFLLYYLFIYTMSQNKRITNNYFYFSHMIKKTVYQNKNLMLKMMITQVKTQYQLYE